MRKYYGFTIIEISLIIIVLSIILSFTINIRITRNNNNIKKAVSEIEACTSAIKAFKRKFGYMPGDLRKTQIFNLSVKDTDGNENGIIEDRNQTRGVYNKNLKIDGEIGNFWLHMYNSQFLDNDGHIFPYIDTFKSGMLVFSDGKKNYYHLAVNGIDSNMEIETVNNLTPYRAYLLDKKLDDGLPFSGKIRVIGGNKINISHQIKPSKDCAVEHEYLTAFKKNLCQLIVEIDM